MWNTCARGAWLLATIALVSPIVAWAQDNCNDVLIPTTSRVEVNTRLALDTVNYLDQGSGETRSKSNKVSLLVPVKGGAPIDVGFDSGTSSQGYQYLKGYNSYSVDTTESFVNITRHVTGDKVVKWAECMAIRQEFYIYVDPKSITPNSATIKVGNFRRGGGHRGILSLSAQGAAVEGKRKYDVELTEVGEKPFTIKRNAAKKAVITAAFGGYAPTVTIAPDAPPLKTPTITYRVNGHLQQARVKNQIKSLPNFDVSVGVLFASGQILLTIEQLVDGKVCASKTISTQNLGDVMDSNPEWQSSRIRVGCQTNGSPVASAVQCFVDPVFPGSCP
jgi:hypothetical protein